MLGMWSRVPALNMDKLVLSYADTKNHISYARQLSNPFKFFICERQYIHHIIHGLRLGAAQLNTVFASMVIYVSKLIKWRVHQPIKRKR